MASFFDPTILADQRFHTLSEEESKHICKVLRLKEGDRIEILDGKGKIVTCTIHKADSKKCEVELIEFDEINAPGYDLHLAIAPTKNADRIEWFIEKATEIGATEFTFLNCKNSERTKINEERIQRILISAMKQSQRAFIPKFNGVVNFRSFLEKHPSGCIAYCGEASKSQLANVFSPSNCPILIGPEGDFTKEEVTNALNSGYKAVTFGANRLRTETAGIVACVEAMTFLNQTK
jgi:16S rRNA (uracil1498-N3)-methyltransferase